MIHGKNSVCFRSDAKLPEIGLSEPCSKGNDSTSGLWCRSQKKKNHWPSSPKHVTHTHTHTHEWKTTVLYQLHEIRFWGKTGSDLRHGSLYKYSVNRSGRAITVKAGRAEKVRHNLRFSAASFTTKAPSIMFNLQASQKWVCDASCTNHANPTII